MMIGDAHTHTWFSGDSDTPPEANIRKALERQLPYICLTDHIDYDYPADELTFDFDMDQYFETIKRLREKYGRRIKIYAGVELGMQTHLSDRYGVLVNSHPFDFVIGSQHLVNGKDPYYPETFEGTTAERIYADYFQQTLENIRVFHDFDSLGHLDYIVRYGSSGKRSYRYGDYADILDEILKLLIRHDLALEVNTAGLRKGLGNPNPCREVLVRYHELGGRLLTVGSDSHNPFSIGYSFGKTAALLRDIGFREVTYYEQRKPKFVKII